MNKKKNLRFTKLTVFSLLTFGELAEEFLMSAAGEFGKWVFKLLSSVDTRDKLCAELNW